MWLADIVRGVWYPKYKSIVDMVRIVGRTMDWIRHLGLSSMFD